MDVAVEQISRFDTKAARKLIDDVNRSAINASFKCTDVGAIDICAMGKLLLGQALSLSESSQIERQDLS
jgi:hypothetical protein